MLFQGGFILIHNQLILFQLLHLWNLYPQVAKAIKMIYLDHLAKGLH